MVTRLHPAPTAASLVVGVALAVAVAGTAEPAQQSSRSDSQQPPRDTPAQQTLSRLPTGRMLGRVLAADNGRPLKRARVLISAAELPGNRGVLTDEDGVFDFTGLPAGRYTLTASKDGFIGLSYGQRRPLQAGIPLQLAEGQQLRGIDFRLPRGSVLSGHVFDEAGDAMPGATVRVLRYQYLQGDRRLVPAGASQTDDRGTYRVWGLNPGDYVVSAVARPDGAGISNDGAGAGGAGSGPGGAANVTTPGAAAAPGTPAGAGEGRDRLSYAPTYYPGVAAITDARPVTLGVSQELLDIDFTVQLVRTSRVRGRVQNPDGSWASGGNVTLISEASGGGGGGRFGATFGARIGRDGTFSIGNVPPGRYTLHARSADRDRSLSASQPLAVAGDLSDLFVLLTTGGILTGSVAFPPTATGAPSDLTQIRISAPSTDQDDAGPGSNARVDRDGAFTLDAVPPGPHLIRPNGGGALRGWTLKSVTLDGRDVTDTPIVVRSGQKIGGLVVSFTNQLTEVNGTVTDGQSAPVTEFTVLAFSTNPSVWRPQSRQIMTARPDQMGMFRIRGLPAGEYYLVTVDPAEPGEWFEPAYLDEHRASATRVTLADGDVKTQDFRVRR